jgi:hypothetical protein
MNQHIKQADRYMEILIGDGNVTIPAHTLASMAIAECLLSIAKSLYALQLENEEIKQPKEGNEDE